jgi:hypothetical protein
MGKRMFHVSRQDLGEEFTLTPKIPANTLLKIQECNTFRVCFSPSIRQCLIGIVGYEISEEATLLESWVKSGRYVYTVYTTDKSLVSAPYLEGSDYVITQEHWSLEPISVTRLGFLNPINYETFKKFDLLPYPPTITQQERDSSWATLTQEQNDLIEKWYSHDYMR